MQEECIPGLMANVTFHLLLVCSCGNCENKEEFKCEEKYKSQKVLTCELHSLAYETECCVRAENADKIVNSDLGHGHSNLCEATFSVFPNSEQRIQIYIDYTTTHLPTLV